MKKERSELERADATFLDARQLMDPSAMHLYLKRKLRLPDWYGENLDALWDILSARGDLCLEIEHADVLAAESVNGAKLLRLFEDLREEGAEIHFTRGGGGSDSERIGGAVFAELLVLAVAAPETEIRNILSGSS